MNPDKIICNYCNKHIGWSTTLVGEGIDQIACLYCEEKIRKAAIGQEGIHSKS